MTTAVENPREVRARLQRKINDTRSCIETELRRYKMSLDQLRNAIKKYNNAAALYAKKPVDQNEYNLLAATDELRSANGTSIALRQRVVSMLDTVTESAAGIAEIIGAETRQGQDFVKSYANYRAGIERRITALEGNIDTLRPEVLNEAPEGEITTGSDEAEEEITYTAPGTAPRAAVTSVNVAPINIDVTPIVERAISAAIDQLSTTLEAKIADYVEKLNIPAPTVTPAAAPVVFPVATPVAQGGATALGELEGAILEDEKALYEQLKTMYEGIGTMVDGVVEIVATYKTLTAKLREVADMQKQVNELQRVTMRDQQGIQANQKVINNDQLELNASQRLLSEQQAKVSETVRSLGEAQDAALVLETNMLEKQANINSAIEAIVAKQDSITVTAQKLAVTQDSIVAKQTAIAESQKETQELQKKLQKEQKTISQRQPTSEGKPERKTKKKKSDKAAEAPVEASTDPTEAPLETAYTEVTE